jgi:dienelactone hydrolase
MHFIPLIVHSVALAQSSGVVFTKVSAGKEKRINSMNYKHIAITLGALTVAAAASAQTAPPENGWVGEFTIGGQSTAIVLHDRSATPAAVSVLDLPSKGARDVPLKNFSMDKAASHWELQGGPDLYTFDGKRTAQGITGQVKQGDKSGTFSLMPMQPASPALVRELAGSYQIAPGHVIDMGPMDEIGGQLIFLNSKTRRMGPLMGLSASRFISGPTIGTPYPVAISADFSRDASGAVTGMRWMEAGHTYTARKIAPHRVEDVTVTNGAVTLKGTLSIPLSKGPHPAVVFAHGSGDATRNLGVWNTFFVRQGMAVLSLDKRGAGASSGDWHTASMDDIAGDWLAGVAMLKARADIDPKRIGVHGSSQGGWTGPLMAARSKDVAFVIVRAGSANSVIDTMVHEIGWSVREAGFSEADAQEAIAGSRHLFALGGASWDEFKAVATPLKARPWADAAWVVHMTEKGWGRPWSALNAGYDPAATLAKVNVPVLWFLGDLDHNVPGDTSAARLAAARAASGNQDFTVVRMPDAGHAFLETKTGNGSEFPQLTHASAGYWEKMESWLREHRFSQP